MSRRLTLVLSLLVAPLALAYKTAPLPGQTLFYDVSDIRQVGFFAVSPDINGALARTNLSFSPVGNSNLVSIFIDGVPHVFGYRPAPRSTGVSYGSLFSGTPPATPGIGWMQELHLVPATATFPVGHRCSWRPVPDIEVTQTVRLARSAPGRLDVAFLEYEITNVGSADHEVGIRYVYDIAIGRNGAPALRPLPGDRLVFELADWRGREVPRSLEALEVADPSYANQTRLRIDFGTRDAWAVPDRLAYTHRPAGLASIERWEIPAQRPADDGVLVAYWSPERLPARAAGRAAGKRRVGLSLGLAAPPSLPAGE